MLRSRLLATLLFALFAYESLHASSVLSTLSDDSDAYSDSLTLFPPMNPLFSEPSDHALTYRGNPLMHIGDRTAIQWTRSPETAAHSPVLLTNIWNAALDTGVIIIGSGCEFHGFFRLSPRFCMHDDVPTLDFRVERFFPCEKMDALFVQWMTHIGNVSHAKKIRLPDAKKPYEMGRLFTRPHSMEAFIRDSVSPLRPDRMITSYRGNGVLLTVIEFLFPIAKEPPKSLIRFENAHD